MNVWEGVSVENQATADLRIPLLVQTPARVRFISQEPQLEAIVYPGTWLAQIDWIIQGGESGPGARPFSLRWADQTREQCKTHGVWYFLKQVGARPCLPSCASPACDHPDCDPGWLKLSDRKGGDLAEIPARYRVREFPAVRA